MSYILEALRKADAERERGSVPDLQSQLLPPSPADDEPAQRRPVGWRWPALAIVVLLLGLAAGWFFGRAPQPVAGPAASQAAVPAASAPSAAVAAASSPVPPSAAASAAPAPVPTAPVPPKAARAAKVPSAERPERAQTARARKEPASTKPPPVAPSRAATKPENPALAKTEAAPPPAAPSAPAGLVLRQNELPEDLRRQVPVLTVGGSVYSPQADKRMVILNGQVFAEGAMLTPELKLEQIRPKSAVLSIRGQRFELPL